MYRLWDAGVTKLHLMVLVGVSCAAVAIWLGLRDSSPELAQDFEDCIERVETKSGSNAELVALKTDCGVRFAGRRKVEGGYTYYDFMQDKKFDIVGPNPTAEERKQIDREYIGYLDTQRREAVSADLARRQNEQLRADIERARQAVGPPMILTPTNIPAAKRMVDRPKPPQCGDDSLACTWSKFSTAVKNSFASSKSKPQ
jgi:hypothetical protein